MKDFVFYTCFGYYSTIHIYNCPELKQYIDVRHVTICHCNPAQSGIVLGDNAQIRIYSEYRTIKNIANYVKSLFDHKWNHEENWQDDLTKLTKESCEFMLEHLGFIPSVKREWVVDDSIETSYPKLCYRPDVIKMTTFMGIEVPEALVNEMSFVISTRNELSVKFPNYEPELTDFPKPLQGYVHDAITALSHGGDITNILYIAIYEFLGIHITNHHITIHGDLLIKCPELPQWTLKFDPPKDCLTGLTGGELEFISDHVVRTFGLRMPENP